MKYLIGVAAIVLSLCAEVPGAALPWATRLILVDGKWVRIKTPESATIIRRPDGNYYRIRDLQSGQTLPGKDEIYDTIPWRPKPAIPEDDGEG
jgi:hypothetical protein